MPLRDIETDRVVFPTPLGTAHACFDKRGNLLELHVDDEAEGAENRVGFESGDRLRAQVGEWFAGTRTVFDIPIAPSGTDFQRKVWDILNGIPYGETLGYGEIARMLGRPGAARAVGQACGANPIWLVVPCHRVVGTGGRLTGYAGGIDRKAALLAMEASVRAGDRARLGKSL